jgi:CO dehydrogenase/acetyl-CoA synthase beta subunit
MNSHFREHHPISSRSREEEEEDKEEEEEEKRIALITSRSFRRRINRKVPARR